MVDLGRFENFSVVGRAGSLSKVLDEKKWPMLEFPNHAEPLSRSAIRRADVWADAR